MIVCTFTGHREVFHPDIKEILNCEIEKLLQTDTDFLFLNGGMGEFDSMSAQAVRKGKKRHPEKHIKLALVLPYMTNRINADKDFFEQNFDEIIIPDIIIGTHYKAVIGLRNRWMIDKADKVIAYVYRNSGGASTTVKYALNQGKQVVNIADYITHSVK